MGPPMDRLRSRVSGRKRIHESSCTLAKIAWVCREVRTLPYPNAQRRSSREWMLTIFHKRSVCDSSGKLCKRTRQLLRSVRCLLVSMLKEGKSDHVTVGALSGVHGIFLFRMARQCFVVTASTKLVVTANK